MLYVYGSFIIKKSFLLLFVLFLMFPSLVFVNVQIFYAHILKTNPTNTIHNI